MIWGLWIQLKDRALAHHAQGPRISAQYKTTKMIALNSQAYKIDKAWWSPGMTFSIHKKSHFKGRMAEVQGHDPSAWLTQGNMCFLLDSDEISQISILA